MLALLKDKILDFNFLTVDYDYIQYVKTYTGALSI